MDITVNVINGIHGRPAEGVEVRVACCQGGPGGERVEKTCEWTNERGQARYTEQRPDCSGDEYAIEIDADIYFASLGVASWQRKITVLFRIIDPADEYQVMSVLTPFMQATYCVRQPHA